MKFFSAYLTFAIFYSTLPGPISVATTSGNRALLKGAHDSRGWAMNAPICTLL